MTKLLTEGWTAGRLFSDILHFLCFSWLWGVGSAGQDHRQKKHLHWDPLLDGSGGHRLRWEPWCHIWLQGTQWHRWSHFLANFKEIFGFLFFSVTAWDVAKNTLGIRLVPISPGDSWIKKQGIQSKNEGHFKLWLALWKSSLFGIS